MKANVGSTDRIIRIIIGIAMLVYAWTGQGQLRWLGWLGLVPIATALFSFCPLYAAIGIRTSTTDAPP